VVQVGAVVSEALVSPFTKPLNEGMIVGTASPWFTVALDAVMVSCVFLTLSETVAGAGVL